MKKALLLLGFAVLLNVSLIHAQNLLTNPGFETWSTGTIVKPTGWTTTNNVNASQNTTSFTEGTKSCRVAASNANFTLSQIVTVTAGKTYSLSVSYNIEAASGTGKDARIWCYFRNATGSLIPLALDDSLGLKGPGGSAGYFTTVTGSWKTYTFMVTAPTGAAGFYFSVITSKGATVSWDNFSFAQNTTPTITCNSTSLTGFTYVPGAGPSAQQSFTVKGNNLTTSIIITAPANYEISATSGTAFNGTSSLTITQSGGLVSTQSVYVRLKSGLAIGTYNGNLTLTSTGATTVSIALTGSVANLPVVITPSVTTLIGFTYAEGSGPSAQKTFSVTGSGLTSGIVITAPANYEISVLSGTSFTGASSLALAQSNGSVASTPIYVRLKSGLTIGSYNGTITLSSNGGTTKNVTLTGTVTAAAGIGVSVPSLTGLNYYIGSGPSAEQSISVSGSSLTSFIIVSAPANFEISSDTGANFFATSQIIVQQSGGVVTSTPIYIRLVKGLSVNTYSGNISVSSTGYTAKTVSLTGNVLLGTAVENASEAGFKAYGSGNELIIEGSSINESISIYNLVGVHLKTVKSAGDRISIPLSRGSVYLVRTSSKAVKVVL